MKRIFLSELKTLVCIFLWFNVSKADLYESLPESKNKTCSIKNAGCNKTYETIRLELFPYSSIRFENYLIRHCGVCFKLNFSKPSDEWLGLNEIDEKVIQQADFIYPILKRNSVEYYHNKFKFLPVLKHADYTYVTQIKMSSFEMAIRSCLDMYPLFIISFMMSLLFGFIIWIFETIRSKDDYPRCFPIGWLKGIWWSMATMISTGPESTPKSVIGRILALLWLNVAVIMVSLITSIVTAAMVKPFPIPTMSGALVGSLRFNKYNQLEILRHNGKIKTIAGSNMFEELSNLSCALRRKELDGVLVDKYILRTFLLQDMLMQKTKQNKMKHYDFPYVLTEIKSGEPMAYGALITKDKESFESFEDFFSEYKVDLEIDLLKLVGEVSDIKKDMQEKVNTKTGPLVFTIDGPYIKKLMIWLTVMIGIALLIGIVYEIVRKRALCSKSNQVPSRNSEENHGESF